MFFKILAITLLLQTAPAAVDLSTPQTAAKAFGTAVLAGDADSARAASVESEASARFIARLIAAASAHQNLEKISTETLHLFVEVDHGILQELRTFPGYAAKGIWDIQGDQARWLLDESATPGVRVTAARTGGKWRINPESMNDGRAATQGNDLEAWTQACNQVADDIRTGRLRTADETRNAHRRYERLALQRTVPQIPRLTIDLSTPASALKGALLAEETADNEALLAATEPHDPSLASLQAMADGMKTRANLAQALRRHFGDAAESFLSEPRASDLVQMRAELMKEIDQYKVVVKGDEAQFEGKDWPVARKNGEKWQVVMATHLAQSKEGVALRIAEGKMMQEMLDELNAGKFKSFPEFQIALANKAQAMYAKQQETSQAN